MTPLKNRLVDLEQLVRLRDIRQEALRVERDAQRTNRDAVLALRNTHQTQLDVLRAQQRATLAWAAGAGLLAMAQLNGYAHARQAFLSEAVERAEYALLDDEQALAQAEQALKQIQAAWLQACNRALSVEKLLAQTRTLVVRETERLLEREAESTKPLFAPLSVQRLQSFA